MIISFPCSRIYGINSNGYTLVPFFKSSNGTQRKSKSILSLSGSSYHNPLRIKKQFCIVKTSQTAVSILPFDLSIILGYLLYRNYFHSIILFPIACSRIIRSSMSGKYKLSHTPTPHMPEASYRSFLYLLFLPLCYRYSSPEQ